MGEIKFYTGELLSAALQEQHIDDATIALLLEIYSVQVGSVGASGVFDIARGVRQGDVISALLFNAVLEYVFKG